MGAGLRLALLIRTAILGSTPPSRPPGWSRKLADTKKCPTCGTLSDVKDKKRHWCEICRKWFRPR
jgi:hypothetical protein